MHVCYLLDSRVENKIQCIKSTNRIVYLESTFIKRSKFYFENRRKFKLVFCFGNIPPFFKSDVKVFTYFHNLLYLNQSSNQNMKDRLKLMLKIAVLKIIKNNSSFWWVQSKSIKSKLEFKFDIPSSQIKVIPFYDDFIYFKEKVFREKYTYIYVSNGTKHKNHEKLIKSFCEFFDVTRKGKLILTINDDYPIIQELISQKVHLGYPIENIGFVDRETLQKFYFKSEYLIFPSLAESFGLGIIEAIDCGCKVIGADLPYTYEICEPSIVFDPEKIQDIKHALMESLSESVKESIPIIKNEIHEIINNLQSKNELNKK